MTSNLVTFGTREPAKLVKTLSKFNKRLLFPIKALFYFCQLQALLFKLLVVIEIKRKLSSFSISCPPVKVCYK